FEDLRQAQDVAERGQRAAFYPIPDVWPPAGTTKFLSLCLKHLVQPRTEGGIDDVDLRPHEMVQEQVALDVVVVGGTAEVEMTLHPQPGAGGRGLPAVVRLHSRAPYQHVRTLAQGVGQEEFVVAGLVPAEEHAGAVVALDEDATAADCLGEAC